MTDPKRSADDLERVEAKARLMAELLDRDNEIRVLKSVVSRQGALLNDLQERVLRLEGKETKQ